MLGEAKHVLLTGAAGAIGGALVPLLADAAPAARLSLVDKRAIESSHPRAKSYAWDLSKPDALPAAYEAIAGDEPVDVLVSCAGFMEMMSFAATPWELGR